MTTTTITTTRTVTNSTTTTTTNTSMAPPTTTSMGTLMAAQPITRTDSNTLSEVDGGGEITEPDVKRRRLDKQASSEGRRRNNIRGQFLRFKEMIPAIKNVKDIEKNEQAMLSAFDTEARQQMARRAMLQKGLADLARSIKDAPTSGL